MNEKKKHNNNNNPNKRDQREKVCVCFGEFNQERERQTNIK